MNESVIPPQPENIRQLKGMVACLASEKVTGIAFVLVDFEKVFEFPKGHILVTSQTSPECVNAMESALAVITERGGILCHAAIVCRDMNIPCIVGVNGLLEEVKSGMEITLCTQTGTITFIKNVNI
jgi:pyruvate, water dikinase